MHSTILVVHRIRIILPTLIALLAIYLLGRIIPRESAIHLIDQAGPYGPIVFMLLTLSTFVLAPLSGSPLTLIGFYAFDRDVVIYTAIATYSSFFINFWIARRFGRPLVLKVVGEDDMKRVDHLIKDYGVITLFFLRLLQGSLDDFISYAAGLTDMGFKPYILVSTIAFLPSTFIWYVLALHSTNPGTFLLMSWVLAAILSAIFILGHLVMKQIKQVAAKKKPESQ